MFWVESLRLGSLFFFKVGSTYRELEYPDSTRHKRGRVS